MSNLKPDVFAIPVEAHPLVKKLYDEMFALSIQRTALVTEYLEARARLEQDFAARSAVLIGTINEAKLKGSEAICKASGIAYDPDAGYAIDSSYIDLGYAFVQKLDREDGQRFDGQPNDLVPPGTRLN